MNVLSKRPLPNPWRSLLLPLLSEYCYAVCIGYTSGLVLSNFEKRLHRVRHDYSSRSDGILRVFTVLGRVGNRPITDRSSRDPPKAFRHCFRIFSPAGIGSKERALYEKNGAGNVKVPERRQKNGMRRRQ